jgi:hypothetical protein
MPFARQKIIKDAIPPQNAEVGYMQGCIFYGYLLAVDVVVFDHGTKIIIFPDFSLQNIANDAVI